MPTIAGAAVPSAAILWAHGENIATNSQIYAVQPPSVSRALVNPAVGPVFAIVMIISAFLLFIAVAQIGMAVVRVLRDHPAAQRPANWFLFAMVLLLEIPAIAGMVVLSQYVGDAHAIAHDAGSYMLFFGHTFAIVLSGLLIRRLLHMPSAATDPRLHALTRHPKHAAWVAGLSTLFAIVYFGGKLAPNVFPFAQHLAMALVEIAVLLAFLSYFGRFWRFVKLSSETN